MTQNELEMKQIENIIKKIRIYNKLSYLISEHSSFFVDNLHENFFKLWSTVFNRNNDKKYESFNTTFINFAYNYKSYRNNKPDHSLNEAYISNIASMIDFDDAYFKPFLDNLMELE